MLENKTSLTLQEFHLSITDSLSLVEILREVKDVTLLRKEAMLREVKDVTFCEKARKPVAGMIGWLERLREVIFNGKDI